MKMHLCALLALAVYLPLRADEVLQNGDFADGIAHWHGDAHSPADFASDNPMQASDPFTAKGMIVPLKHSTWCKVAQDFRGKVASAFLTIGFKVSPDFALSTRPDDYSNIPNALGWGWRSFSIPPGALLIFVSALGDTQGTYYMIKPQPGATPQNFRIPLKGLTPLEDQTLTLAFPPGTGTLVVLGVSINDHP